MSLRCFLESISEKCLKSLQFSVIESKREKRLTKYEIYKSKGKG